jgi:replicative DNA helicase
MPKLVPTDSPDPNPMAVVFPGRKPERPEPRFDAARIPPHSIEAEQAVLGGLMLSERAWDRSPTDRLTEEDFYRRDHQLIFRAIGELGEASKPCDAVTLGEWFEAQGHAEQVGGSAM